MVVVQAGPLVAGVGQVERQRRLPDALGQPGPAWPLPESRLQFVSHPHQLAVAVAVGERDQDRLVVAAADDLDLATIDEPADLVDRLGLVGGHPLQQRPGVVKAKANPRMPLQGVEHRRVGVLVDVLDHPAEVADRLVVVDDERERNTAAQSGVSPLRSVVAERSAS